MWLTLWYCLETMLQENKVEMSLSPYVAAAKVHIFLGRRSKVKGPLGCIGMSCGWNILYGHLSVPNGP